LLIPAQTGFSSVASSEERRCLASMSVSLVHPHQERQISTAQSILKCTLFKTNVTILFQSPYATKSSVPIAVFREFTPALDDSAVQITNANFAGLSLLCAEFGFEALAKFRSSASFVGETGDTEARIAVLEE
jgi:hypothetical protein